MGQPCQIVLTGVSRGLGRALAIALAERGHVIHGCARNAEALVKLRAELDRPHTFEVVDVTQFSAVDAWAHSVLAKHRDIDLLINNAGAINPLAPLWQVDPADFDEVLDVNVRGTFHVLRCFLPAMVARKQGIVVNVSSGWGRSVSPEVAAYCASKWAIEGLTRSLARELPEHMAAVTLDPGIVDTDMLRGAFGSSAGMYPEPEQWAARAVEYILNIGSAENGQALSVPRP